MKTELTPEKISEIGKMWTDAILAGMTPEERLAGLKPEEIEAYLRKLRKKNRNRRKNINKA